MDVEKVSTILPDGRNITVYTYNNDNDPVKALDREIAQDLGKSNYTEFIDANMDNPWVRVIIHTNKEIKVDKAKKEEQPEEVIFQHTHSKIKVQLKDTEFYVLNSNDQITEEKFRREFLTGQDWRMISPRREVYESRMTDHGEVYFRNMITGVEYRKGMEFTIPHNCSYADGQRDFKIHSFYISDNTEENRKKNRYEFIYANTGDGKSEHLSKVILK